VVNLQSKELVRHKNNGSERGLTSTDFLSDDTSKTNPLAFDPMKRAIVFACGLPFLATVLADELPMHKLSGVISDEPLPDPGPLSRRKRRKMSESE